MKILHVIPSLSPALGGPTQVALKIVRGLRNQGIDAEIVTTNHDTKDRLEIPLNQLTEYQGVPVWFLPAFSHSLKEYIFSSALTKWLWQRVTNYDLLDNHYLFSYAPTCAAAIARLKNTPYTVRTQGQLTPWALQQSPVKKKLYTKLIESQNLSQAAAIHCTTSQEAQDLRNFGITTPTITLPLGVDPATPIVAAKSELHRLYNIPDNRLIILFLSRLHAKKRPDLLINAFNQVVTQNSTSNLDFHLIMAGSGDPNYVNHLQQLVAQHHLTNQVTFAGFVSGNQKDTLLQGSDIFALPSHSENFGIAVAEAMAAGLPVIVTSGVQIASDISTENAGIIINNETELVTAISQLLKSPELRSHLSQNAISLTKKRYAWDKIASQLISAYGEIINK